MAARLARFCGLTSLLLVSTHAFSRPPSLLSSVRAASRSRSSQRPSGARSLTKPSNQPLRRGPAPLRLGAVEEALAGAFFPLSLPPYLAFLYWAGYAPNQMPKMALFGFQFLLVFVLGSIPAAVLASSTFGVSLADCDWLHGSAEGLLTITNLLVVLGLRSDMADADGYFDKVIPEGTTNSNNGGQQINNRISKFSEGSLSYQELLPSALAWAPAAAVLALVAGATAATATDAPTSAMEASSLTIGSMAAVAPVLFNSNTFSNSMLVEPLATSVTSLAAVASSSSSPKEAVEVALWAGLGVHSPFLGGVGDLPAEWLSEGGLLRELGAQAEPINALTVPTWMIHTSSLVEWLVAMGLIWKRADYTGNERWRGVTWGMLPLHSSGLCACTYHLFYNADSVGSLVALQAFLTVVGNTTLAYATLQLAISNGWRGHLLPDWAQSSLRALPPSLYAPVAEALLLSDASSKEGEVKKELMRNEKTPLGGSFSSSSSFVRSGVAASESGATSSSGLSGFEDLGESLELDSNVSFGVKLLVLSLAVSYVVKYGELFLSAPFGPPADSDTAGAPIAALACIAVPTALNCAKWAARSRDPKNDAFNMF